MNKIIFLGFLAFLSTTNCMEPAKDCVHVKTSDAKILSMPRWQIRESNTLYSAFLKRLTKLKRLTELKQCTDHPHTTAPVCITALLSYEKLELYHTALNQKDFDSYYHALSLEKQQDLITIAGKYTRDAHNKIIPQLDDITLTAKLVSLYHYDPLMIADRIIQPCFCNFKNNYAMAFILNHFKRIACIKNAQEKTYRQTKHNYSKESAICQIDNGSIGQHKLPTILQLSINGVSSAVFNGISAFSQIWQHSDGSQWQAIQYITLSNNISYIVTHAEAIGTASPLNIIRLWAFAPGKKELLLRKIKHSYPITKTIFNKKGTVLTVCSRENDKGNMSLTPLEVKNNNLTVNIAVGRQIPLLNYPGFHHSLTYGSKKSILVAGIHNAVMFWDTKTGELIKRLPCLDTLDVIISLISFNCDDSRLALSSYKANQQYVFMLYDTSNIMEPELLATVDLSFAPRTIQFFPYDNKLVIGTTNQVLVLDEYSGNTIMETDESVPSDSLNGIYPILMPQLNLLALTKASSSTFCSTTLWDITSKAVVASLIENESRLSGIGTILASTMLASTFYSNTNYIATDLCSPDDHASVFIQTNTLLKQLTVFQLYCLYRINKEYLKHKKNIPLHRQSLLYKGIKSLPNNIKEIMYDIFPMLHPYGSPVQ